MSVAIHKKIKKKEIGYFMLSRNSVTNNSLACDTNPHNNFIYNSLSNSLVCYENLAILIAPLSVLMFALAL
ncbi:hypothetical protein [Helicobacter macacae]|uniref:Uncharacterized protein n=1 Tax=Helicobacter macacae MIT 99-5501 TaxID=1357400 RepID=V8CEI2_9HELI|nr:hypothetical protein [Helicobacter macacae]ETD25141.1 hypothetical protein HMPREF2086_00476 [Helicobacter macacae MIT 99-5501]